MTIEFQLDEKDLLTHQLFMASKSKRIKKKRLRTKVLYPVAYLLLGALVALQGNYPLTILLFIIAVLWLTIYPLWERNHYIRHYKGFIKENFKDLMGRIITLEFHNDYILAKDNGSESKILTTELEEIHEIQGAIFLKLKGGQAFVLPKNKINNVDNFLAMIKDLSAQLKVNYNVDFQWKWM